MKKKQFEKLKADLLERGYKVYHQQWHHEDYVIGKGFHKSDNHWEEDRSAYQIILSVYDYDILTLSHYTDDSCAGVKLSLVLQMPSPVDLCSLEDNFNDEPYSGDTDTEITINEDEVGDIDINPIHLPRTRVC